MNPKETLAALSRGHTKKFQEHRKKGEVYISTIVKLLSGKSSFKISRVKIMGSIGYRSAVETCNQPDFDVVVFLRNKQHVTIQSFDEVIANFEKILREHYNNSRDKLGKNEIIFEVKTSHSLQFRIKDGGATISFDLHPTVSLLDEDEEAYPDSVRVQIQTAQALKLIQLQAKSGPSQTDSPFCMRGSRCYYSCILAERNIDFVEGQNEFVKDVIRLAQLWNKKVTWGGSQKVYGRSTMIEFVAIAAACKEEINACTEFREVTIQGAIELFLKSFIDWDRNLEDFFRYQVYLNLQLEFQDPANPSSQQIKSTNSNRTSTSNALAAHLIRELKWTFEFQAKGTLNVLKYFKKVGWGQKYKITDYFGVCQGE